jgi:hypothetical protein
VRSTSALISRMHVRVVVRSSPHPNPLPEGEGDRKSFDLIRQLYDYPLKGQTRARLESAQTTTAELEGFWSSFS